MSAGRPMWESLRPAPVQDSVAGPSNEYAAAGGHTIVQSGTGERDVPVFSLGRQRLLVHSAPPRLAHGAHAIGLLTSLPPHPHVGCGDPIVAFVGSGILHEGKIACRQNRREPPGREISLVPKGSDLREQIAEDRIAPAELGIANEMPAGGVGPACGLRVGQQRAVRQCGGHPLGIYQI